jgi:hypothetical protein
MEKESYNILAVYDWFEVVLNDHTPLVTAVKSTCSDFEVPKPQKFAKKPHQNKRPRTNRTQPRYYNFQ